MSELIARKELGDFNSIICFRSIVTGLEKVMGKDAARGNLIRVGRLRGIEIVQALGLSNTDQDIEQWSATVADTVGKNGTHLCVINNVELKDNKYYVSLSDTICSAYEEQGSDRLLSFTQGAVQGVLEEITGHRLLGTQVGSILRGDDYDIIEFKIR